MRNKKPHILWTLFWLWWYWRQYPQLRLGQLIDNSFRWPEEHFYDIFNVWDEDVVGRVGLFVKRVRETGSL